MFPPIWSKLLVAMLVVAVLVAPGPPARSDAIIRSQAMLASTIMEFIVEPDRLRVELEIGLGDVKAFRNILPDELLARIEPDAPTLAERVAIFSAEDLLIQADGGDLIVGRLVSFESRPRLPRDEVSGEPRPQQSDDPEELALFAVLEYPLPGKPETLQIQGRFRSPAVAAGFVLYHGSVAVNDFRYLGPHQHVELDWNDPWYSRFESRVLRRQYFAPMSGFIYVEPYEVRKEIIVRPSDLQQWVDLGLEGRDTIPPEIQPELLRRAAEFLREHHPVVIDGESIVPELDRIHFLERTLRSSRVIDPPETLDLYAAIIGAIFVYPIPSFPERVSMDWDLWYERLDQVPVASVDAAGPLPSYLDRDWHVLEWQNFLKIPVMPEMLAVEAPPSRLSRSLLVARWVLLPAGIAMIAWALIARSVRIVSGAVVVCMLLLAAFMGSSGAVLSQDRASSVVSGLLHNIYRAFDFRTEDQIYDVLMRSVEGELLESIYLETRRGLELQSQGGARAKVKEVELLEIEAEPAAAGAFEARVSWQVGGSVGHWGHVHQRRNRYRAELRIVPRDGAWKLEHMDVIEEERL